MQKLSHVPILAGGVSAVELLISPIGQYCTKVNHIKQFCQHQNRNGRRRSQQMTMFVGGVSAAQMLISATSSNAILGGQQLAQAQDVSYLADTAMCDMHDHTPLRAYDHTAMFSLHDHTAMLFWEINS